MNVAESIDGLPLVGVFFIAMFVVLASIATGFLTGRRRRRQGEPKGEGVIGSAVAAMLGLLAFILAFTFGTTASRYDTRRELLLNEVNAIGTTALRIEMLPEANRDRCLAILRDYVDVRVSTNVSTEELIPLIVQSEKLLNELWAETVALNSVDMDPPLRSLFVQSVNEVIDLHTSRVTVGMYYRIPASVWIWLLGATVCSMFAVGYQFGFSDQSKVLIHVLLATLFASVVMLIADLDRASQGTVRINLQPMIDLQQKLNSTESQ